MIEIVDAGIASTVQDHGRPGFAHLGVSPSGAVDTALAALVNRLVGNPEDAAVIETGGGLAVRALRPVVLASSTEAAPVVVPAGRLHHLRPSGQRVWEYLAVRGGVDVAPQLGSRATDTLSGLGPPPLRRGDRLPVGRDPGSPIVADVAPVREAGSVVRVLPGPRCDWFAPDWPDRLAEANLTVTVASRVGVRLVGAALPRVVERELPSEGLIRGAVQVPPSGELVVMAADHPTTGGYPVVAVVHPDDLATLVRRRPGESVRIVVV